MLSIDQLRIGSLPPLTFAVQAGECMGIEGPSGVGKTRLLRAIADLDCPDGYIYLNGLERATMPPDRWRRQVCYVAAEPGWWAATAEEHFQRSPRIERMTAAVGLAPQHLVRPLADLSTGERQRLALIRALAGEPPVLLLDEPTASLDAATTALVEEVIRYEIITGRAILLVSHDEAQMRRLAHARLQLAKPAASAAMANLRSGAAA